LPVGGEGGTTEPVRGKAPPTVNLPAAGHVPGPQGLVDVLVLAAGGEHVPPVGRKSNLDDRVGVSDTAVQLLAALHLPDDHDAVVAAGDGTAAVGGKGDRVHLLRVALQAVQFLAAVRVPDADRAVVTPGKDAAAVRGDGHAAHPAQVARE